MKLSLVIPAYNEEKRLAPFLRSITQYTRYHPHDVSELIIVDDGSTDATVAIAQKFQRSLPQLRLIQQPQNMGKGAAVQTGVLAAKGDYVVFMDADGATSIFELPKMIAALHDSQVAIGNRWLKGAHTTRHSLLRRLAGFVYRTYMRLFGLGRIDTMCGFKGYRRSVAKDLFSTLQESRWLFDTEIAYKAVRRGYHIKNFPIRWESKDGSKLSTFTQLKVAWRILPLIRRIKRSEQAKRRPVEETA